MQTPTSSMPQEPLNAGSEADVTQRPDGARLSTVVLSVVLALPLIWPTTASPDVVQWHLLLAFVSWGFAMAWTPSRAPLSQLLWPALGVGGLLSLVSIPLGATLGAAVAVFQWVRHGDGEVRRAVLLSLVIAALLNAVMGILQVWTPGLVQPWGLASAIPGRPVGFLRQPNHLSSLLLLGLGAWIWWVQSSDRHRDPAQRDTPATTLGLFLAVYLFLLWVVDLTGSRTGAVGTLIFSAWGLLHRGMSPRMRALVAITPLLYVLLWGVSWWMGQQGWMNFGAQAQFQQQDMSSSRFKIWHDTWVLIKDNPWTGVGWGNFNLAWTLTVLPDRPTAFFDHCHNIVLQFMVELGIPATLALLAASAWVFWHGAKRLWLARLSSDATPFAAASVALMLLLHSLLEYPLWYPYFLMVFAGAMGLWLGAQRAPEPAAPPPASSGTLAAALNASLGAAIMAGGIYAMVDYDRVGDIYRSSAQAPLAERIEHGRHSPFFAYHAEYARVTMAEQPSRDFDGFDVAMRRLIDTRLMATFAKALEEKGLHDQALYVTDRLREFRKPEDDPFLAACEEAPLEALDTPPFQCDHAKGSYTWRDFDRLLKEGRSTAR